MFVDAYASLYHNSCCSSQLQSPCLWLTSPRPGGNLNPNDSHNWFHPTFSGTFFRKNKPVMFGSSKHALYSKSNGQGLGLFPIHPSAVFVKSSRLASRHSFSPCIMGPSVEKPNGSCSAANFFLLSNGKLWEKQIFCIKSNLIQLPKMEVLETTPN